MSVGDLRRLGTFFVAALMVLSALVTASPAEAGVIPLLGTTTITAASSSSVIVDVPKDVPYSFNTDPPGLIAVSGRGRAIAATLQPIASRLISEAMVVALFNGCATPGCAPEPHDWLLYRREPSGARRTPDGRAILAAGRYRLSVLTDGSPVEVQVRLDGVAGSATGATTSSAESGITPAREVFAVPASPSAWSGSADLTFASENSLLLAYLQQDSPTGAVVGVAGVCHFTGATRPLLGVPVAGCPFQPDGGDGQARVGGVATEQLTFGTASSARLATALSPTTGAQQAGLWSKRIAVTETPLAFFMWLRLS